MLLGKDQTTKAKQTFRAFIRHEPLVYKVSFNRGAADVTVDEQTVSAENGTCLTSALNLCGAHSVTSLVVYLSLNLFHEDGSYLQCSKERSRAPPPCTPIAGTSWSTSSRHRQSIIAHQSVKLTYGNPLHSYTLTKRKQKEKLKKQFHSPLQ